MKLLKCVAVAVFSLLVCCVLTGCESFYELFIDDSSASAEGVYFVIFDENSSDEEIAAIPDVHLMAADIRDLIKEYGLSFEVTVTFDTETDNEASLSLYYYHNRYDESADDYLCIGMTYLGTYTFEDDTIIFSIERDGYNIALYTAGSAFADLEAFRQFSYAEDKGNGVWAYASVTWDYEDVAVIDSAILDGVPDTVVLSVSGSKIVSWEAR